MNKFSKEYIKECDCKEIQGLRVVFEHGDWYWQPDNPKEKLYCCSGLAWDYAMSHKENYLIWLPTGDQLDEEIEKISIRNYAEYFAIKLKSGNWRIGYGSYKRTENIENKDRNLAKIKLLKELLK